jgi:S1-C subfamily serine protease
VLSRPVVASIERPPREAAAPVVLGVADAPPHIRRALRANLLVRCRDGKGGEGLGSGVVVGRAAATYWLLTNRHVAECGGTIGALTAAIVGGPSRPAALAWRAPEGIDAVVLKVEGEGEPPEPARIGRKPPRVGDPVFAVGNPLGYEATFTVGVVSAIRQATYGARRVRVFQVQAAVNPGHSGGGLYDAGGDLIGLNTWAAEKSRGEGLGFAVSTGEILGLASETAPPELTAALDRAASGRVSP